MNDEWEDMFQDVVANFLPETVDHCPCVIQLAGNVINKSKPFRFFNMWAQVEEFHDIVQVGWQKNVYGVLMFRFVNRLKGLKRELKMLNKKRFSNIE